MTARPSSVDLFCRVVDNFGDIGVCWRLARQLAVEEGIPVRLVVDRLDVAHALVPQIAPSKDLQLIQGVTLQRWQHAGLNCESELVIEAFACELPEDYLASMAVLAAPPVWVNLEYLSAEPWVAEDHGLPSPHPRLPLTKHFFFPGFGANTGGLLRERGVALPLEQEEGSAHLRIFAFAYDSACVDALCAAIAADKRSASVCAAGIPPGGKLQ
ncbi:MAG: elongation factor P maturation arginine rhamnosyltransferase EarP, partial [Betaproteobacteria bacterium]|nr:elongation factor P maturation arginine rhamnosyltransferase EarP [Betaproteobacteria bacterium]